MKKIDSELLTSYLNEVRKVYSSESSVEYHRKNVSGLCQLSNGMIYEYMKPNIKTSFCFGHGFCGVSTKEDEDFANSQYHNAKTNPEYFINANLREIDGEIERLKSDKPLWIGHQQGNHIAYLISRPEFAENNDCQPLSDRDRQSLIELHEEEKEKFKKRLNTYLKKYGLSKLDVWTYLCD